MSKPLPPLPRSSGSISSIMQRHGGIALMLSAQLCSAILSTIGRILRTGHGGDDSEVMGTSEILLFMMVITMVLSWSYVYLFALPDRPLGPPPTRMLLVLRGVAGFFGIWGFYYSLRYLALAEASIINFLAPILAVLILGLFPGARLSVAQLLAGLISMGGIICVLQPWDSPISYSEEEQAIAVGAAFVGVLGGAVSFVAISRLGDRVHPILTVAYFSTFCVVLSGVLLVFQWHKLQLPTNPLQWVLAFVLGILAFAMHWLLTASLTWDADSKRPLNFVYTQILFAMIADKVIWGLSPNAWKYVGGALIVCSAIFVASTKASHHYALVHSDEGDGDYDDLELELNKDRAKVAIDSEHSTN